MDRNIIRKILLRIDKLKCGEAILINDLNKEFPDIEEDAFLTIISKLAVRYYIRIDSKYSHDCYILEKYNKIIGLEREGLEALDCLRNDKIWSKVEEYFIEQDYEDFSIFTAVIFAKEIIKKEAEKMVK